MEKPQIYVYLIGGFTDNIKIYNIKETELAKHFKITFVVKNNYISPSRSSNKDLSKNYHFDDIIDESELPRSIKPPNFQPKTIKDVLPNYVYCYNQKPYGKSDLFITKTIITSSIHEKLLKPSVEISEYCKTLCGILKSDRWVLLGNRCTYYQKAIHGRDKIEKLMLLAETLEKHPELDHLVIALDDADFMESFRYIFGDILENRQIIFLKLRNTDEHEYIQVATCCYPLTRIMAPPRGAVFRKFLHDHSGFYTLLESYIGINRGVSRR